MTRQTRTHLLSMFPPNTTRPDVAAHGNTKDLNELKKGDCATYSLSKAFRLPSMRVVDELYSIAREHGHKVHAVVRYMRVPKDRWSWRPFAGYAAGWAYKTISIFVMRKRWLYADRYDFPFHGLEYGPPTCLMVGRLPNGNLHMLAYRDGIRYDRSDIYKNMRVKVVACPPMGILGHAIVNIRALFI